MSVAASLHAKQHGMAKEYLEGWLSKKSPSGIRGFRVWQKRYFKFLPSTQDPNGIAEFLVYFKDQTDTEAKARIPLDQVQYAEYLPNRHEGARFNILTTERVYELHGETIREAKDWVQAINTASREWKKKKAEPITAEKNAAKDESVIKWSRLQELFFSTVFGKDVFQQTVQHQQDLDRIKAAEEARRQQLQLQLSPLQKVALPNALKGAVKIMIVPPSFLSRDLDGQSEDKNQEVDIADAVGARGKAFNWADIEDMKQNFGTDALVIRYILNNVVQPFVSADEEDRKGQVEQSMLAARGGRRVSQSTFNKVEETNESTKALPDWATDRFHVCGFDGCDLPLVGRSKYCIVHRPRSNDYKQKTLTATLQAVHAASNAASGRVTLSSIFANIEAVQRQKSNETESSGGASPRSTNNLSRNTSDDLLGNRSISDIEASPSLSASDSVPAAPPVFELASPREPAPAKDKPTSPISSFQLKPFEDYDDKPLSVKERVQRLNDVNAAHIAYMKKLKEKAEALAKADVEQEEKQKQLATAKKNIDSRGTDVDMRLLNEIKSKGFIRTLLEVFSTPDQEAHALGATLLYFLVPQQFAAYLQIYVSGERLSIRVRDALVNILLHPDPEIIPNLDVSHVVGLFRPVIHPDVWPAMFFSLQHSQLALRQQVLQDCNALLISSPENCLSIEKGRGWQSWIFPLLTDIHLTVRNQEPYKTVYMLIINTIDLILFEAFHSRNEVHLLLYNTLNALRFFGGNNDQSQDVGRTILLGLINKLNADKSKFQSSDYLEEPAWNNFMALTRVLRRFVFVSTYWETDSPILKNEDLPMFEQKPRRMVGTKSTMEKRQMAYIEFERRKLEEEATHYVLHKERTVVNENSIFLEMDKVPLEFYGFHWSEDGKCANLELIQRMCVLFQSLHLHSFDKDMHPSISSDDREFLVWAAEEYAFWKAAYSFCSIPTRPAIENNMISYRKLSFMITDFLRARLRSVREEIIKNLQVAMDAPRLVISDPASPAPRESSGSISLSTSPSISKGPLSKKAGGPGLTAGAVGRSVTEPSKSKHAPSMSASSIGTENSTLGFGPAFSRELIAEDPDDKELLAPPPPLNFHVRQSSAPEVMAGASESGGAPPTFGAFLSSSTWSMLWPGPESLGSGGGSFGSSNSEDQDPPPPPPPQ